MYLSTSHRRLWRCSIATLLCLAGAAAAQVSPPTNLYVTPTIEIRANLALTLGDWGAYFLRTESGGNCTSNTALPGTAGGGDLTPGYYVIVRNICTNHNATVATTDPAMGINGGAGTYTLPPGSSAGFSYDGDSSYWTWADNSTAGGAPPSGAASGDLAGTYPGPTVTRSAGLKSATTTVGVSAATAPTSGQVLTATSSTAATWQNPSSFNAASPPAIGNTTPNSGAFTSLTASGHMAFTGAVPTISAAGCGLIGRSIDAHATDNSGAVTIGGTPAGSCTITFAVAYSTWNHCMVTNGSGNPISYSYTLSAIDVDGSSSGDVVDYRCDGQ